MYEMMLGALKAKNDDSSSEELLKTLALNKSMEGGETQELIQKYSESALKLEEILKWMKGNQKENDPIDVKYLKESHKNEIKALNRQHQQEKESLNQTHRQEIWKLQDRIKQLEMVKIVPEVWEIDLSSAIKGLKTTSANDYMSNRSEKYNTRESCKAKERMTSPELSTSTTHSKIKNSQRSNYSSIQSMKKNFKSPSKISNEEYEKLKRKWDKQKVYIANQKINEKKIKNDYILLTHKVKSLNKDNNELKHRLNKLLKAEPKLFTSKSKNRLGSHMARGINKITNEKAFAKRKQSHAIKSPRIKKVLSDRNITSNRWNIAFGRRETLDINKSGSLLNLGHQDDTSHQNSEMLNIITSDDENSVSYLKKSNHCLGLNSSRNKFIGGTGSNTTQIKWNNTISQLRESICNWNDSCQDFNIMGNNQNITKSNRINQESKNSHLCNWDNGRQSMENELMNHVSNAVSSFLSMRDEQNNHWRRKSKSDLGFINPWNYGNLEEWNEYNESSAYNHRNQRLNKNILKEYNGWRNLKERCNSNSCLREQKHVSKCLWS